MSDQGKAELIAWLNGKLTEARKALSAREQMAKSLRSGSDSSWAAAAKLHQSTAKAPPFTREQRLGAAESHAHIATKCQRDVAMLERLIELANQTESEVAG